ncbi:hypothetical protein D9Q98_007768 [Chlorella vulgaris]|uniref:Beta'-coat protein n=1 Tax=Chlorella vulgaris TaxID=3077 RepID=A0A9D4THE9_CHLVU|nr:hypothetical protein D9Q98_007768 [Chlorella vulgaris]
MPLRLDIKKIFSQRSDRVKSIELHPTEPWILASLYSGHVYIWNYAEQSLVKSFEATDLPVRTARFVPRKQWVICGADDMHVRVYNYNTMDKVKQFEAHTDYIRHIAVHPTLPYVLTCSDDMLIKLWDWDKGWQCTQIFEGHSHYVMQLVFNPKDTNTFASASLDRTIKVWSLGNPTPNMTLEGHEKGVNCVDYYSGGDRPYLISGADDRLVKVWDYQTKACIQTLDGHSHNISTVCFHPELPLILTGSEDGTVKLWHSTTYRLENTLNYGMERVWAVGYVKGSNSIAVGYDEGCVMVKLGREEPVASMDASGKIIWAKHNEVQTVNVKSLGESEESADGERLPLAVKDLGSSDIYPQSLEHSPNGRFVTVCGDGEYVIYTALAWRNKSFGSALEFVWGDDSNVYATRESSNTIKVHRNFKEALTIKTPFSADGIYGGQLLGVRSQDFICFYDWATGKVVRRIDVAARGVYWSEGGSLVAIASEASFYMLEYNRDVAESYLASGQEVDEDGIEDAFELTAEIPEKIRTGIWVGDCFIYNNAAWRLNYCVGGEVTTLFHLDKPMYLLGYLASQSRVYLMDKDFSVIPYTLLLSVVEYKTLVLRGDMETAGEVLETIPKDQHNSIAKFLEAKGMAEEALQVATDADYRFELAVSLGMLDLALELAGQSDSEAKWSQLGELALGSGQLEVAQQCFGRAKDLGGLLLLHSSHADAKGMGELAALAEAAGKQNIAFICHFLLGRLDECVDLLVSCGRLPEAAFFARTYAPSRMTDVVKQWQADLAKINPKAAESLANPDEYPNLFPGIEDAFKVEAYLRQEAARPQPAARYPEVQGQHMQDILSRVADLNINGGGASAGGAGGGGASPPAANGAASAFVPAPVADLLGLGGEEDEEEAFGDAEAEPEEEGQPHVAEEAFGFGEAEVEAEHEVEEAEAEAEEDVFADAAAPSVQFEPERPAELAYAAPVSPPYAAAGPADVPAATASGLTAEEEALLAEDEDDDLLGGDLGVDDADLNDADVNLDDDWGLDDDDEEAKEA